MLAGSGTETSAKAAIGTLLACLALLALGPASAPAQAPASRVLVYTGPADPTTEAGVAALEDLGEANDFEVAATAVHTNLNAANLALFDAVVFLNAAGNHLTPPEEAAVKAYVDGGGGFLAIGSSAQAEPGV